MKTSDTSLMPHLASTWSDQELIAFAKSVLSSPETTFKSITQLLRESKSSFKKLGISAEGLKRYAAHFKTSNDLEAFKEMALEVIRSGDEEINRVVVDMFEHLNEGREKGVLYQEKMELDSWEMNDLRARPDGVIKVWVESNALYTNQENTVNAIIEKPHLFEGPIGLERLSWALPYANRRTSDNLFWLCLGPNALSRALTGLHENDFCHLSEAIEELVYYIEEQSGNLISQDHATLVLTKMAKVLGEKSVEEGRETELVEILSNWVAHDLQVPIEAAIVASGMHTKGMALTGLLKEGIQKPDRKYIRNVRFHGESARLLTGVSMPWSCLAHFWERPDLLEIGVRLGEDQEKAKRLAETLIKLVEAYTIDQTDTNPNATERAFALAESAALIWHGVDANPSASVRATRKL